MSSLQTVLYSGFANSGNACSSHADRAFGPAVSDLCRAFDFTLIFEQSILSIAPSALLLLCVPLRLYQLRGLKVKTLPNYMGLVKAVTSVSLAACQLAILIAWPFVRITATAASVPSAALSFAAALAVCQLSYVEHGRTVRPSTLLNIYLLVSIVCDAIQLRTLCLISNSSTLVAISGASLCVRLCLLVLESQSKQSILRDQWRDLSPEMVAGVLSRSFFWWIIPLLSVGHRKLLTIGDLPPLDDGLLSAGLRSRMRTQWDQRKQPEGKTTLLLALGKCILWPIISAAIPRICITVFSYVQPFLISRTITFVSEPATESAGGGTGYELIVAAFIIYTGMAISNGVYQTRIDRCSTMVRGALVGLIHERSLSLQDGISDDAAQSQAVTLMSSDVDMISSAVVLVHAVWVTVLEVILGLTLLGIQLGWVCLMPLFAVVLCSRVSAQTAKKFAEKQKNWSMAIQKRITVTSSMLGSMKALKMMGLSNIMENRIQGIRVWEIGVAMHFRWLIVVFSTASNSIAIFAPSLTFIVFAIRAKFQGSDSLSTNVAFTSLSLISLVTAPCLTLMIILPMAAASMASFERIQKFLLNPSWDDQRLTVNTYLPNGTKPHFTHKHLIESTPDQLNTVAIEFSEATVRPSRTAEPAFRDINVKLDVGGLLILVGPVGSGKTTLIKAILGELPVASGKIFVSSKRMAYCAQTAWLSNESIQRLICGPIEASEIDTQWYQTVVHACGLEQDIEMLPHGDQSVVGSRGLSLSGGQKQRVALARTVYARLDIVLLDDVLSALDAKTEDLVVDRLMGPQGIFRKLGTTVVLVTHATKYFHLADRILVLAEDSHIAEQCSYDDLKSQSGYISKLKLKEARETEKPADSDEQGKSSKAKIVKEPSTDDTMDITRRTGDMSVYGYWLRSIGAGKVLIFLSLSAAYSFFLAFPQYWLKLWTDNEGGHMIFFIGIYILLSAGALLFNAAMVWIMLCRIGPRAGEELHRRLLRIIMRAPQSYFVETDTGVTLNRFSQDMQMIDRNLPQAAMMIGMQSFKLIAQGVLLFSSESYLGATVPFCVVAIYFLQKIYLHTSRQMRFLDLESRSPVYSHFLETLEGLSTIRAFGWERNSVTTNIKRLDVSQTPYYMMSSIQRWLKLTLDLLIAALAVIVVSLAVTLRDTTSGGQIGIGLNVVLVFNATLRMMIESWTNLEVSLGAIARLKTFEAKNVPEDLPQENQEPPASWPTSGAIEFCNVNASYNPDAPALRELSINILPGQKIGICGRTGSGKSSLLLTLLRLLDYQSGSITIDGLDLANMPRETIRQRMIAIPQDPFVISESVRANADPSGLVSDERIISALKKVKLWDILESREGGLDAQMKAQPLSQGQQQIFCLARAMLRDGKVLVLDEATSNVDAETDKMMQSIIREEFASHTIITVAHRLDTIADADMVAVLERGRLVEFGKPEELMGRESAFRNLHGSA